MKRLIIISLCFVSLSTFGQNLPQEIQRVLDQRKTQARNTLENCRISKAAYFPDWLRDWFPLDMKREADKYNLNLGMIYDDSMRNRIVQLLKNEYREDELDTLVTRWLDPYNIDLYTRVIKLKIFDFFMFDTLQVYKDSLADYLERKEVPNTKTYRDYYKWNVMNLFSFDTITACKKMFDSLFQEQRNEVIAEIQNRWEFNINRLIVTCGYINDQRFVAPLENIYNNSTDKRLKKAAEEALVRMQINPYYENYVRQRTRTIKTIQTERPNFELYDFTEVLRNQEAYRELSKYLLSDVPYMYQVMDDEEDVVILIWEEAYSSIKDDIKNADLQEIMKGKNYRKEPQLKKIVYDWMQENYGKYEIRRIW